MKKNASLLRWLILSGLITGAFTVLFYLGFKKSVRFETTVRRVALITGIYRPEVQQAGSSDLEANYKLELIDLEEHPLSLSELKGKVVFMKFWATWCPPCVAEIPHLNGLFEKISNKDIVFLMISKDEHKKSVRKFMQKKGYDFPVYQVSGPLPAVYQSQSIPITFVISPNGKIVYKKEGMTNYNSDNFTKFLTKLAKK